MVNVNQVTANIGVVNRQVFISCVIRGSGNMLYSGELKMEIE